MKSIKNKFFKTIALLGAIVILFSGCINERKVAKYLKEHPSLTKSDTVFVLIPDTTKAINIKGSVSIDTSHVAKDIDSIFNQFQINFKGQLDSVLALKLKGEIKNYTINKPILLDTTTQVIDGIKIKLYQVDGKIHFDINRDQEIINKQVPVSIDTKISLSEETGFQKFWRQFKDYFIVALLGIVSVLMFILIMVIKKKIKI